jgi:hypothetical protein
MTDQKDVKPAVIKSKDPHERRPSWYQLREAAKRFFASNRLVAKIAKRICDFNERSLLFARTDISALFQQEEWCGKRVSLPKGSKKFILTDCQVPKPLELRIGPVLESLDGLSSSEISNSTFFIYFKCDSDALPFLEKIQEAGGKYIPHLDAEKTEYRFISRKAYDAVKKTWERRARYPQRFFMGIHENICEALELTKALEGDYVELGVYQGCSAMTALNYIESMALNGAKKAWLLDTFEGFSYELARKSSDVIWADTHHLRGVTQTMAYLRETFEETKTPFELVQLNICNSELPSMLQKIAVANIDVDMFEATLSALNKCAERLVVGGIMICEDPASTPALYGAFLAMNEFLKSAAGRCFMPLFKKTQYFLIKIR